MKYLPHQMILQPVNIKKAQTIIVSNTTESPCLSSSDEVVAFVIAGNYSTHVPNEQILITLENEQYGKYL